MFKRFKLGAVGLLIGLISTAVGLREISEGVPFEDAVWYLGTSALFLGVGIWGLVSGVRMLRDLVDS